MRKAVVLVLDPLVADEVARLIAGTLTINGYDAGPPHVIDWPPPRSTTEQEPQQ